MNLVNVERSVTIGSSLNGIILKKISNEVGEKQIATVLVGLILRTSSFFNITNNLTENQAIETAFMLIDKFSSETIEDFVLMFKNAKSGKYGQLYNRLDGQIIIEWMFKYLEEKAEYRENIHQRIKTNSMKESNDITKLIDVKKVESDKLVIDALKKAIDFDEFQEKEKSYSKFKSDYITNKKDDKNNS